MQWDSRMGRYILQVQKKLLPLSFYLIIILALKIHISSPFLNPSSSFIILLPILETFSQKLSMYFGKDFIYLHKNASEPIPLSFQHAVITCHLHIYHFCPYHLHSLNFCPSSHYLCRWSCHLSKSPATTE